MTVVIKNIPEDKWRSFKSEAARRGEKLGEFFAHLVDDYMKKERNADEAWNAVFKKKAFLSEEEAVKMKEISREFRRNFRMRI